MTDDAIAALKKEDLTPTGQEAVTELEDFLEEALQYLQFKTYYDQIAENAKLIVDDDQIVNRAAHIKNVKEVMDRPPSADHHGRVKDPVTRKDLRNQLKREKAKYDELLDEVAECLVGHEHGAHEPLDRLAKRHPELLRPAAVPEFPDLDPADTSDLSSEHMQEHGHTH